MSSSPPISSLSAHLGFWLRYVSNHVSHAFAAKLAALDVTVAEWVMMRALYDKAPMAPSRLAADMGVTRGAVTKLADRLIAKALVVRRANRDDKRAQTLALTPRGVDLTPVLAALADLNDAEVFAHLSPSERDTLERLLKGLIEAHHMTAIPID